MMTAPIYWKKWRIINLDFGDYTKTTRIIHLLYEVAAKLAQRDRRLRLRAGAGPSHLIIEMRAPANEVLAAVADQLQQLLRSIDNKVALEAMSCPTPRRNLRGSVPYLVLSTLRASPVPLTATQLAHRLDLNADYVRIKLGTFAQQGIVKVVGKSSRSPHSRRPAQLYQALPL